MNLGDYPDEMRDEIYSHMDALTLYRLNQVHATPLTEALFKRRLEEEDNLEVFFYVNYVPGLIRWVKKHIEWVFELVTSPGKRFDWTRRTEQMHDVTACLIAWARYDLQSLIDYLVKIDEDVGSNDYNYWIFRLYAPLFHQRHYDILVALMGQETLLAFTNEFLSSEGDELSPRELARFFSLLPDSTILEIAQYNGWNEDGDWDEVYGFLQDYPDENTPRYKRVMIGEI